MAATSGEEAPALVAHVIPPLMCRYSDVRKGGLSLQKGILSVATTKQCCTMFYQQEVLTFTRITVSRAAVKSHE